MHTFGIGLRDTHTSAQARLRPARTVRGAHDRGDLRPYRAESVRDTHSSGPDDERQARGRLDVCARCKEPLGEAHDPAPKSAARPIGPLA